MYLSARTVKPISRDFGSTKVASEKITAKTSATITAIEVRNFPRLSIRAPCRSFLFSARPHRSYGIKAFDLLAKNMEQNARSNLSALRQQIAQRSLVLVGMMGAGKTTIGRRLAQRLNLPFTDADNEIEQAAGMKIPDIFEVFGEQAFRDGERKVLERLLKSGPQVLATGGGAFLSEITRAIIKNDGLSIWLKAELQVLIERVKRKSNRPLLLTPDPEDTMRRLLEERAAVYALADIVVESNDNTHEKVVSAIIDALTQHFTSMK
jgi:shikimate kinase